MPMTYRQFEMMAPEYRISEKTSYDKTANVELCDVAHNF
jgi:hypothetical protein